MFCEDVEQAIRDALDELLLGRGSYKCDAFTGYVIVEFAAFVEDGEPAERVGEIFKALADRFPGWTCKVTEGTNLIVVDLYDTRSRHPKTKRMARRRALPMPRAITCEEAPALAQNPQDGPSRNHGRK